MCSRVSLEVTLPTLRALLDYLAEQAADIDLAELAELAIRDWLQHQRAATRPTSSQGYLWKTVFLPEGTRLRIATRGNVYYAEVMGDELIHDTRRLTPNQFATACLGNIGNAWKAIHVQLPGENDWTQASRLRFAAAAHALRTAKRKVERTAPQSLANSS